MRTVARAEAQRTVPSTQSNQNHKDQDYVCSSLYATSVFMIDICFGLENFVNIKTCLSLKMMPQMQTLYFNALCYMNIIKSCFKPRVRASNNILLIFRSKFCSPQCVQLFRLCRRRLNRIMGLTDLQVEYNMVFLPFDHISYTNWSNRWVTTQTDGQHIREYQCHGFLIG